METRDIARLATSLFIRIGKASPVNLGRFTLSTRLNALPRVFAISTDSIAQRIDQL